MSRTVRKSAKAFSINADSFAKHQTYRSHIRVVRRRKTEEEYQMIFFKLILITKIS